MFVSLEGETANLGVLLPVPVYYVIVCPQDKTVAFDRYDAGRVVDVGTVQFE